jgi:membrane protease YdiL (CAAX protease family)
VAFERPSSSIRFSVGVAFFAWTAAYVLALPLQAVAISLAGYGGDDPETWPISMTVISVILLWIPFVVALVVVSQYWGGARPLKDFRVSFRLVDVAGIPIGIASQLILLPLVYWPLQNLFPDTFSSEDIEERARELWDKANGVWVIALIAVVVIGAPLIEEIVYRGMILQALQGRLHEILALILSAAWFGAIHLQPVEFPGLFIFGLVLGLCFQKTGRLGSAILAHAAFNATGLLLVSL